MERFHLSTLQVVAATPGLDGAVEALARMNADVLLVALPTLNRESAPAIRSLARQVGPQKIIVEYGFGTQRIEQELRAMGCSLVHAPVDIAELESLCRLVPAAVRSRVPDPLPEIDPAATRRFDDRTLAEISLASVVLNCECPHHIADLLVRLGNFEAYSAGCESRLPDDPRSPGNSLGRSVAATGDLDPGFAHPTAADR